MAEANQNDELVEAFRDAARAEREVLALQAERKEFDDKADDLYARQRHAEEYKHQTNLKLRDLISAEAERLAEAPKPK